MIVSNLILWQNRPTFIEPLTSCNECDLILVLTMPKLLSIYWLCNRSYSLLLVNRIPVQRGIMLPNLFINVNILYIVKFVWIWACCFYCFGINTHKIMIKRAVIVYCITRIIIVFCFIVVIFI